ncbi:hypothetical protein A2U01_0079859, partial [Trifolium medium]|nr:hypothetical protein [Trifolium medium]
NRFGKTVSNSNIWKTNTRQQPFITDTKPPPRGQQSRINQPNTKKQNTTHRGNNNDEPTEKRNLN